MNTPHHMARMSDDSPRGLGVRSDVRKRQAAQIKTRPITIRSDGYGNWEADCDSTCANPMHLACGDWADAYESAVGHACLHHGAAS